MDSEPQVEPEPTAADLDPVNLHRRLSKVEGRQHAADWSGRRLVRRAIGLVIVITLVAAAGVYRVEHLAAAQTEEQIDRQVEACQSANEFRRLFRGYLGTVGAGPAVKVTALDGFAELDPATQDYVRRLAEAAAASATAARKVRDEYVDRFPIRDCVALRRTLTR